MIYFRQIYTNDTFFKQKTLSKITINFEETWAQKKIGERRRLKNIQE